MATMRDIALLDEWKECTGKMKEIEEKMKTDSNNHDLESVMKDISDFKEHMNYTAIVGLELYSSVPEMQELIELVLQKGKEILDAINKFTEAY